MTIYQCPRCTGPIDSREWICHIACQTDGCNAIYEPTEDQLKLYRYANDKDPARVARLKERIAARPELAEDWSFDEGGYREKSIISTVAPPPSSP